MPHLVSVILEDLALINPDQGASTINGAQIGVRGTLRAFANHPDVSALEIFVPPHYLGNAEYMAQCAVALLEPQNMGKDRLIFLPVHAIPYVWADARPRILYCATPEGMYKNRYVRDRFARGTMPITADSHSFGMSSMMLPLARLAEAPPVPFDSIVAMSQSTVGTVQQLLADFSTRKEAVLSTRVDLIPRGVDETLFIVPTAEEKVDARDELGLPTEGQILLYLGRVSANTKADLAPLLRCFADAKTKDDDYLVIAGTEEPLGYQGHLISLAQGLGIADRVVFHGRVEPTDRHTYFAAADIFILPSDTVIETLGITVLEAMATGLPCIVSDWDGLRDSVVEGETGFKVPTWWMPAQDRVTAMSPLVEFRTDSMLVGQSVWIDTDRLTETIELLFNDPELRQTMGANGRTRIEDHYAQPVITARWIALWDELVGIAGQEPEESKKLRFVYSSHLGAPIDYIRQYSRYASNFINQEIDSVVLTARGNKVMDEKSNLDFYPEVAPLVAPQAFGAIMTLLEKTGTQPQTVKKLVDDAFDMVRIPHDDLRFVVALLLKQGLLRIVPGDSGKSI
jgi:glycosyltransferase involved in cell wall biosynthesis